MVATSATLGRDARAIGLIGAGHFMSHFYQICLPPLFPLIRADLGVSYIELGVIVTVYNAATAILQTPVGFLIDRIGGRRVLIIGLVINAGAMALAGLTDSYWALLALMLVAGAGNSVFHPADYALLSSSVHESRLGRAYSIHSFTGSTGFAAAPFVMLLFASLWDWRMALVAVGLIGVAIALMQLAGGAVLIERPAPLGAGADGKPLARPGWRALMTRPILIFFVFYVFLAGAGSGLNAFTPSALIEIYDTDLAAANAVLTVFLVVVAVSVLFGGALADRTRRHDLVLYTAYGIGVLCLAAVATTALPFWTVFVLFAIAAASRGIVNPTRDMMVRKVAPEGSVASVFAFVTTGFNVGQAIAPLIYGWLMDEGFAAGVFGTAAAFMAFGILLVMIAREREL